MIRIRNADTWDGTKKCAKSCPVDFIYFIFFQRALNVHTKCTLAEKLYQTIYLICDVVFESM
jgi:hypothetical protein